MENNKGFLKGLITGALLMAATALLGFSIYIGAGSWDAKTAAVMEPKEESAILTKVGKLAGYIEKYSLNEVDDATLVNGLYKGMLNSIGDPYSVYYTADEYKQLMETTTGTYYGIGVVMQQNPDTMAIRIVKVFKDSPAEEAGMKTGDILVKVNEKDITKMESSKVISMIKGKNKEKITIEVKREEKNLTLTMECRKVEAQTVEYKMLENQVGYIVISEFDEPTAEQFKNAVNTLKKQGAKGIVFDLRDNPGGLYSSVVEMLDYILPKGRLVYMEDKEGNKDEQYSDASCLELPFSVIINGNSASAAEIFAGAIQDFGAGKIVGTTSFGKGIVQRLFPLDDGSALKLTIAKYYTPNGKNIHGIGIKPDEKAELSEKAETYGDKNDNQLKKAIEVLK